VKALRGGYGLPQEVPVRKFLVLLLVLIPSGLWAGEKPWFQGSLDQAFAAAKGQNKALVLKFYADW
jgi:hypothetical protein